MASDTPVSSYSLKDIGQDEDDDLGPVPAKSFRKMVSVLSNEGILRGMPAFQALHAGASIFGDSTGSEQTFGLSAPTPGLRWFISHNWSVSRFDKFAVLALFFNFIPAVLATMFALALIGFLTAKGHLPHVEVDATEEDGDAVWVGVTAQLTSTFVFLFVLFTWHEIGGRLTLQSLVFLDKTCISQTDDALKQKGITSLAAFLGRSDGMLVVYTDVYLRKMWTVYELASLLILFPSKKVMVVPTFLPKFVVVASLLVYLQYILKLVWALKATDDLLGSSSGWVMPVSALVLEFCFYAFVRSLAREEETIRESVKSFRISEAACFNKKDRELVCESICHFMKQKDLVPAWAGREDCLGTFDQLVRREVPRFLINSLGRKGMPYHIVVAIFLQQSARYVDWAGAVWNTEDTSVLIQTLVLYLGLQFLALPCWVRIVSLSLRGCLELHGLSEIMYMVTVGILLSLLAYVGTVVIIAIAFWEHDSGADIFAEIAMWVFLLLLTCFLYRPTRGRVIRPPPPVCSEPALVAPPFTSVAPCFDEANSKPTSDRGATLHAWLE